MHTAPCYDVPAIQLTGPAGDEATVQCLGAGLFVETSVCSEVAVTLNAMTEAFIRGGFQSCEVTTPTTSETTTPSATTTTLTTTTSATTSPTTTTTPITTTTPTTTTS